MGGGSAGRHGKAQHGETSVTELAYRFWRRLKLQRHSARTRLVKGASSKTGPRIDNTYPDKRNRRDPHRHRLGFHRRPYPQRNLRPLQLRRRPLLRPQRRQDQLGRAPWCAPWGANSEIHPVDPDGMRNADPEPPPRRARRVRFRMS